MKKILALLLTLLLMTLPVLSQAVSGPWDMINRYTSQGKQLTVTGDIDFDGLLDLLPEDVREAISDLSDAISFQFKTQETADGSMGQMALVMLLNGEEAFRLELASSETGLYADCNWLGDDIYAISAEEAADLTQALIRTLVDNGYVTAEDLEASMKLFSLFLEDPSAAITEMIGEVDIMPLLDALTVLFDNAEEMKAEELSGLLPEATEGTRLVLTREALKKVMTELAGMIASMHFAQEAGLDAAELAKHLNAFNEQLEEDIVVTVQSDSDGTKLLLTLQTALKVDDILLKPDASCLLTIADDTMKLDSVLKIFGPESGNTLEVGLNLTAGTDEEDRLTLDGTLYADVAENENEAAVRVLEILTDLTMTAGDDSFDLFGEQLFRVRGEMNNDTEPVGIVLHISLNGEDNGTDANVKQLITVGLEGVNGWLLRMNTQYTTDLAEAWIVTDHAIYPLSMSEEELEELGNTVVLQLLSGLVDLLSKLPESTVSLIGELTGM